MKNGFITRYRPFCVLALVNILGPWNWHYFLLYFWSFTNNNNDFLQHNHTGKHSGVGGGKKWRSDQIIYVEWYSTDSLQGCNFQGHWRLELTPFGKFPGGGYTVNPTVANVNLWTKSSSMPVLKIKFYWNTLSHLQMI